MTADAKVGLLLGLVFIVIIAFLVNGLPNYFKRSEIEVISQDVEVQLPNQIIAPPLRDYIPTINQKVKLRKAVPPNEQHEIELTTASAGTQIGSKVAVTKAKPEPRVKTYKVQDGDALGRILEEVYGSDGKKQSTIALVVKVNGLDSPHLIREGQDLKMPDLSMLGSKKDKGSFFKDLINKVTKKKPKAKKPEVQKPVKSRSREYKVKAGECLSAIAAEQCGTIRYVDEIVKLNKLDDADDIVEGLALILPRVQLGK